MATATARLRAPELAGEGGWINTDRPLTLAGLRGRVVLLDFWTFCCINCLRVIEELRPLEERFGDALVVIGVHSPKFPHESSHEAVASAVRRHRIAHPVLDDPTLDTWQRYGVRAWPTLVVIDPQGYLVATASGEGNGAALEELVAALVAGRPAPAGPAFTAPAAAPGGELAFPGKVAAGPGGRIAVADTGHDRVLLLDADGRVLAEHGGLHQPQGVRFDGERLLVCDTVAGTLLALPLDGGERRVLAAGMHSPWDVVRLDEGRLAVAEAGRHRIVAVATEGGEPVPLAGSGAEGLRDGPAERAQLAQPSGLAIIPGGGLAVADSEVSALRVVRDGAVTTLVGRGLFEWGESDGEGGTARLQHPLGVVALGDGSLLVADTFNSRLRRWHEGRLETVRIDTALSEPGGLDVLGTGELVIADTNNHRVLSVAGDGSSRELVPRRPAADSAGEMLRGSAGGRASVEADVDLGGEALDPDQGPPVRVTVSAEPASLLGAGPRSWALDSLPARLSLELGRSGRGSLRVEVVAATCSGDVCTVHRAAREHPLEVD